MADTVSELVVRITGDASDLESAIKDVTKELNGLEKAQGGSVTANGKATQGLSSYQKQMEKVKTTLDSSQKSLTETKKAYEEQKKAVEDNAKTLSTKQKSLERLIATKQDEIKSFEQANTVVNKGSVAYKDNLKAIQWTKDELEQLKAEHRDVTKTIQEQNAALEKSKKAYDNAQSVVETATKQYKEYEDGLKAVQKAQDAKDWQEAGKSITEVGDSIDTVTKPIQYAAVGLAAGGVAAAKFAMDFEDSFSGVEKTVDGTPEQIDKIKQSIIDMSTVGLNGKSAIPLTTTELNELAAAGGQLGIQTENIADFTEVMAQMGTATNLAGEQGASTIARFLNVMDIGQGEIRNVGSAIVDLGNNSATTEAEIAAMALRMGKTGKTVRMSGADVLGYSAALSSLGVEAELGGSAVGRVWLDIETAVAQGGAELEAFSKYSGKSAEEFKQQWNSDSKGAFNGLLQGLTTAENLTLALDELGINNTQDLQVMQALVNGYDLVTKSVERANTAYSDNTALQEEFDKKAQTTASQLQITKNNVVEAARGIGETLLPTVKDVSGGVAEFAQKLAAMNDEEKKAVVNSGLTVAGIGAAAKTFTTATKFVGEFTEALGAIGAGNVSLAGMSHVLSTAGIAMAPALVPAAVVAGYKVIAEHVTEAIDNNAKLGQSYKELYKTWEEADSKSEYISSLRDEYTKLQSSISSGALSGEELESAKNRTNEIINEIKNLVSDDTIKLMIDTGDYEAALDAAVQEAETSAEIIKNKVITTDSKSAQKAVSEGYDAVEKGSSYGTDYIQQQNDMMMWLQTATDYKNRYRAIIEEMNDAYEDGSSERTKVAAEERQSLIDEMQSSGFTEAYEAMTGSQFKFSDMDEFVGQIDNVRQSYMDLSGTIQSMDERAENGRKSLAAMAEFAQNRALQMNGFDRIDEVFESGANAVGNVRTEIASMMSDWGFANEDIAAQIALFRNGFNSLQSAIDNNALDAVISNFIQEGHNLGMTSSEIVQKAALMKNGFSDVQQAIASGNINGVINDLGRLGGNMGMSVEQVDALARSIGLIPDDKHIEITAEGDYSIIEGAAEKIKELDTENVHVYVNAEGDISVLNQATGETQNLQGMDAVSLQVNADGNIDVLNTAGDKIAEIKNDPSATITVNTELGETPEEAPPVDGKANFELGESPTEVPDATGKANYELGTYPTSIPSVTATVNVKYEQKAKGTQNFEGGLAMVNDERGISDPRELIVDKGHAFIPEGRDVILPLSKGAKVYTASQTKAIMSGIGIPRYAEGKNNSDAFTEARDNWNHYKNTHAVTTSQELEKWVEFSEQFKDNIKDVWDIEEKIFSLTQKRNQEINEQSKAYIVERSALNDWNDVGDSPIDAFNRVKERNLAEVEAGRQTWEEYNKTMSDIGGSLYYDMKDYSDDWLEHQRKYHNMSIDEYIAGIDREEARLEAFYANDLINTKEYLAERQSYEERRFDAVAEKNAAEYAAWEKDADAWYEMRSTYGDWEKYGDSEEAFIKRKLQRIQAFYEAGTIGFEEYIDDINKEIMELYKVQSGLVDDILQKQQEYISSVREELSAQEKELQDSWTVADRQMDMADVQSQLDIYAGAVTDRGQEKYKELQEQMKQLQRDEELYQLQVKNNAVIEGLEEDYKILEENKKAILENMRNANINIEGYVDTISTNIDETGGQVVNLLENILNTFGNLNIDGSQHIYEDNRSIDIHTNSDTEMLSWAEEKAV